MLARKYHDAEACMAVPELPGEPQAIPVGPMPGSCRITR
jgi:hypothetical protein